MNNTTLVELITVLIWPLIVIGFMMVYRNSISRIVAGLGQRVTKLSVFNISIELAAAPTTPNLLSEDTISQNSEMTGGQVHSTHIMMLFNEITIDKPLDYLVVDVKAGRSWFISRLFIFTVFLQAMRGLKCIVFVQSDGKYRRRILGITSPEMLCHSLGENFTWLRTSFANALNQNAPYYLGQNLPPGKAGEIIGSFIQERGMRLLQNPKEILDPKTKNKIAKNELPDEPINPTEWLKIENNDNWEHTYWLDLSINQVSNAITYSFADRDESCYTDTKKSSNEGRIRGILTCNSPYIALVNSKDEFKTLIDRQKLAALVGDKLIS